MTTPAKKLFQGQSIPATSEAAASGSIKARITRGSQDFGKLVKFDPAVVFKDEEKTGADLLMTPRLVGCIAALACLVQREWPGIKLRVVEAWDENGEHAKTSLHYEGRAADMTTSDRDGSKLGRLAVLAAEAGFDFSLFEDKHHVHASVKA